MFAVYMTKDGVSETLNKFTSKDEARGELERLIEEFLIQKEGDYRENSEMYREPSHKNSWTWNNYPFGFIKTRKTNDSLFGITIWHKKLVRGWIWNSYEMEKVMTIDIIKVDEEPEEYEDYSSEIDYTEEEIIEANCFAFHKSLFQNDIAPYIHELKKDIVEI